MDASALSSRLDAVRSAGGFAPEVVSDFAAFLSAAPDEELFRISPLRYAAARGQGEREALDLFLHATHAGLCDFTWGVLCPGCVAFLTTGGGLRSLAERRRCEMCRAETPGSIDDWVEVAFTISPSVRRIRFHDPEALDLRRDGLALTFSSSLAPDDPFYRTVAEHLHEVGRIAPGAQQVVAAPGEPGPYMVIIPTLHAVLHFVVAPGAPAVFDLAILDGRILPDHAVVAPGASVVLHNRTARSVGWVMSIDPIPPPEARLPGMCPPPRQLRPFVTGKRLITSQTFRELFRAESIPSEGGLELKNLTVLFTDLKGSTEMYERIGDLRAYDLVRRHFAVLREIVASRGGSVVKTIGDAIMASFSEAAPAVEAAAVMNREVLLVGRPEDLVLKIGLHSGPCIAVDLNDRLDYFGQTVNVAARVQRIAEAGEIVLTEPVFGARGVGEAVRAAGLAAVRELASLKGIAGTTPVVRLR
ncbi:MAG: adenylate/guanylate cyclase domain-containing protein [Myxococcales bacterium]|nr:adenylate/guanylate cyclase domain-containing protein [Myxococcales bacterium]